MKLFSYSFECDFAQAGRDDTPTDAIVRITKLTAQGDQDWMPADIVHADNPVLARIARKTTPTAALAALGIVYGDLGTSPLADRGNV